jgi:hypothetical protein
LHTGGTWIKYLDPKAADRFYKSLVRRCRKTELGHTSDVKRWFVHVDENGSVMYPVMRGDRIVAAAPGVDPLPQATEPVESTQPNDNSPEPPVDP